MKKNKKKIKGAKIPGKMLPLVPNTYNIEINGYLYAFVGMSFADSLAEAIEGHVEEDREFKHDILVFSEGEETIEVCTAAALCTFGYMDRGDLAKLLITKVFDGKKDE